MKKTLFVLLGAALMVVAGCKKDDNKLNNGEKMTFTSDLSGGAKTEISGKLMKWTEGDEIVINGKTFTSEISQEGAFATFTGDVVEPTYHAYYPASLYDNGNYVLPATQTYNGTNLSLVNPMYASSENTTLQFHNICALVKLDLTGTDKVKTIVAQAEKPLSGAFTVKEENGTFYAELSSKDAATVTLNCGDGVQLDATTPTTFYMALPQGTYENLAFTVSNGTKSTVVDAANATLEAGHIWNKIAEVSFIPIIPDGALSGVFTVEDPDGNPNSGDEKKVHFSQGNLTYNVSTTTWAFFEHQYDRAEGSSASTTLISLFTWGYGDWSINPTTNSYLTDHTSDGEPFNPSEDWGKAIDDKRTWRTLTAAEWQYLFGHHPYKWVSVNGVNGYVIASDDFSGDLADSYTDAALDANNLVFLPFAGRREGSSVLEVGYGNYWSSSAINATSAYRLYLCWAWFDFGFPGSRGMGYSVRLVTDIK